MVDAVTPVPLQFPNIGNALAQGTHARYYAQKAEQEANAFAGEQAARPDIAAAIGGDQGAQGRVAQASPTTFAHIAPHIAKLDADKRAQVKSTAEAVAHAANTFLQAAPNERAALYPQIVETLKSQGHDVSNMPPMMTESQARVFRGQSQDILKLMQGDEAERGRNARHNPVGGLPYDAPSWSTPAPAAAPGARADAGPSPMAPPVNVAQAAPVAPTAPPPQMAQGAAPVAPQPSGEPQVVQGDSPGPTPQAAPGVPGPVATPPPGIPQGFQPMGHRDASGNLVPAMIDGKPVYRNAQSGQMMLGDAAPAGPAPPAAGPAPQAAPPTRAPVPTAPNAVVHTMPPGYEMVRQKGIPVVKDGYVPIISQNGPPLLLKPSDEKAVAEFEDVKGPDGNIIAQRNKQTNQYHPVAQRPASVGGIPPELADAHGDVLRGSDWWKAQSPILKNNVEGLLDGSLTLSNLSKRTGVGIDPYTMQGIAKQIDPTWSGNDADARKRFETQYMTTGLGSQIQSAANTALPHMATLHDALSALAEGDTSGQTRAGQAVVNAARNFFGDPKIASVKTAATLFAPEVAKLVRGGGALNEHEEKAAATLVDQNAPVQSQQAALITLSEMLGARIKTLEYTAKEHGVPETKVKGYLSPAARSAMDSIHSNPIKGSQEPSAFDKYIAPLLGGSSAPAASSAPAQGGVPTMTPEQVRAAPPGTKYRTIDGREGVRP